MVEDDVIHGTCPVCGRLTAYYREDALTRPEVALCLTCLSKLLAKRRREGR